MGWISPTGFIDPDSSWNSEANAYDDSEITTAYSDSVSPYTWSKNLELTIDTIYCDAVRIMMLMAGKTNCTVAVDVFYDGSYHQIYSGLPDHATWKEISIPAGTKQVSKMRIRQYNATVISQNFHIYEADFNQALVEKTGSDSGSGADALSLAEKDIVGSDTGAGEDGKEGYPEATIVGAGDSGSGQDAKASANPLATLLGDESGEGLEALLARDAVLGDSGEGVEASSFGKVGSDSGTGVEHYIRRKEGEVAVLEAFLDGAETGAGDDQLAAVGLTSEDAGAAIDFVESALAVLKAIESGEGAELADLKAQLEAVESGTGIEASTLETFLFLVATDQGYGADAVVGLLNALTDTDVGFGFGFASGLDTHRLLQVTVLMAQYRNIEVLAAQHRQVEVHTAQHRKVKVITARG